MNIHIHSQHVAITDTFRDQIIALLQHALERFAEQVESATVNLQLVRAARGDAYTHCRILATVPQSQIVIVERIDADQGRAIAQASVHLSRAVEDHLAAQGHQVRRELNAKRMSASKAFRRQPAAGMPPATSQSGDIPYHRIAKHLLT
jgi:ribosome-associated translation inhibitor RaiA